MMLRMAAATLLVLAQLYAFSRQEEANSIYPSEPFELEVNIKNLGRSHVGCGVLMYTICVPATITSKRTLFDREVFLYITCPEIVDDLPPGDDYTVLVTVFRENEQSGLIDSCFNQEQEDPLKPKAKLIVLDIKVSTK